MENRLALVVAIDGLRASALGTYGNTTFPTPHFDNLASRAIVAERLFADSPKLADYYQAAWQGRHSFSGSSEIPEAWLPKLIQKSGGICWLLTDDPWVANEGERAGFAKVIFYESQNTGICEDFYQTHMARFAAASMEHLTEWQKELAQANKEGIFWIHLRGLIGSWDAPLHMRIGMLEEGDPEPVPLVEAPRQVRLGDDPDEMISYQVGYAAQVEVIDLCLGKLIPCFESLPTSAERLVMLAGTRGFALGEHGQVGYELDSLHSEQLHLPWLTLRAETETPLPRVEGFAHPADLRKTLLDWFKLEEFSHFPARSLLPCFRGEPMNLRQLALARSEDEKQMISTPAWMLHSSFANGEQALFVKPDDRWELNDVTSRCPEIVKQLAQTLEKSLNLGKGCLDLLENQLPESLVSTQR